LLNDHSSGACRIPAARIDVRLPHAWNYIREVRARVQEMLAGAEDELRSAAMMAVSELIENAVKYGEGVPGAPDIIVSCCSEGGEVRIVVSNGCQDGSVIRRLQERIQLIMSTPDKEALYMARLEELMADATESGSLGLYRIAFEGRFELHATLARSVVTVTATRRYA
jgi:hypothetical protein